MDTEFATCSRTSSVARALDKVARARARAGPGVATPLVHVLGYVFNERNCCRQRSVTAALYVPQLNFDSELYGNMRSNSYVTHYCASTLAVSFLVCVGFSSTSSKQGYRQGV